MSSTYIYTLTYSLLVVQDVVEEVSDLREVVLIARLVPFHLATALLRMPVYNTE